MEYYKDVHIEDKTTEINKDTSKESDLYIHIAAIVVSLVLTLYNYFEGFLTSSYVTLFAFFNMIGATYLIFKLKKTFLGHIYATITVCIGIFLLTYIEGSHSGYLPYYFMVFFSISIKITKGKRFLIEAITLYVITTIFGIVTVILSPYYPTEEVISYNAVYNKMYINHTFSFLGTFALFLFIINKNRGYMLTLVKGKEYAEEEKEIKTRALSNLGHELRTQINNINSVTHLLLEQKPKSNSYIENFEKYAGVLDYCNNQMMFLVNDILDIHKIEAGFFKLFLLPEDLNEILSKITWPFIDKAAKKNIAVTTTINTIPKNLMVEVDKARLLQVLHNLLANAVKFTEQGNIDFSAELLSQDSENVKIKFSVTDTGIGIDKKDFNRIFESFQQVTHLEKSFGGGTGLGLAISNSIVEKMDSKLQLQSELNKGSKFYFIATFKKSKNQVVKKLELDYKEDFLKDKKILIVEDNMVSMLYTTKLLRDYKAIVLQSFNGLEAIEAVKNNVKIDLVLLDLEMPKLNGLNAIKVIKKQNPTLKVIAFTANIPDEELLKSLKIAGFDDFIAKPFLKEKMFALLHQHI